MKHFHLHKISGLRIHDDASDETVYLNTLDQAAQDTDLSLNWPDDNIMRIFPLKDGRLAIVRQTEAGLRQEAAPPAIQTWMQQVVNKADLLIQKQQERGLIGEI